MSVPCNPKQLLAAARCLSCLTPSQRRLASTALKCSWSNSLQPAPPVPPPVPTDLDIDAFNSNSGVAVRTIWDPQVPPPLNWQLWKYINALPYALVTSPPGGTLLYDDPCLIPVINDLWRYELLACNAVCSGPSNTVSAAFGIDSDFDIIISIPDLAVVLNDAFTDGNGNLLTFSLPHCYRFAGRLDMHGCNNLLVVDIPNCSAIEGDFNLNNNVSVNTLTVTLLQLITGTLDMTEMQAIVNVQFPSLVQVLTDCILADLAFVGVLTDITCNLLATVGGTLTISAGGHLDNLGLAALTTVGASFNLVNTNLGSVTIPNLVTVTGNLNISGSVNLTTLSLPSLSTVSGGFSIDSNSSLSDLSLPSMNWTNGATYNFTGNALNAASIKAILLAMDGIGLLGATVDFSGGTNAGYASWDGLAQAAFDNLALGNTMSSN